ncbi:MAG: diguanylate cyclase, partial [Candidatus Limnocylindrales bacterium]
GGWVLAEKIRIGVVERQLESLPTRPSVSIGVVSYPRDGTTIDGLMISADRAMYASKRAGRNRVAGPLTGRPDLLDEAMAEALQPPV